MKSDHVPFDKMSDLFDNLISTEEEKDTIIDHFDECIHCSDEYDRLKKTICHLSAFRDVDYCVLDFSGKTIKVVKWRQRRKQFFRVLPAAAASIVFVVGIGFYSTNMLNDVSGDSLGNTLVTASAVGSDMEKVVQIISDHKGKIMKVSDLYIEGEVSLKKFNTLRRDLGFRKVVYSLVDNSALSHSPAQLGNNMEAVGVTSGGAYPDTHLQGRRGEQEKTVRFRVFK